MSSVEAEKKRLLNYLRQVDEVTFIQIREWLTLSDQEVEDYLDAITELMGEGRLMRRKERLTYYYRLSPLERLAAL